ncbi:hypothetical protein COV20_05010 [Candidatus Woesearchaeota archaeon CG10_big_fil_rev_8_21_14_0_10_45_16]|nr:MAG: hypothetical protein COV20_05010 [Candidatus Woesearchaeota archaeon CG10_big_fil_rev_8_21_14_0_10_45_16]
MKLSVLQVKLKQDQLDVAVFFHPDPNLTYLTQYVPSQGFLCVSQKEAVFYVSPLDKPPKRPFTVKAMNKGWEKELPPKFMKIGINKESLTLGNLEKLKKIFPKAKFTDVSAVLKDLRRQKLPQEIKHIAKACQITSKAFQALIKELPKKTLKTEQDVAFFLEKFMKQKSCGLAFPTIVAMGRNAAIPHHQTGSSKLQRGFLLCDFGGSYNNYCADMTRMVFLGKPSAEERGLYALLLEAQELGISLIATGKKFKEIDGEVRKKLGKYAKNYIHSLGHGVGVEVHEEPSYKDSAVVEENTVFTIEPGIYFPGKMGFRIEDTVFFDGRVKILTTASKELPVVEKF